MPPPKRSAATLGSESMMQGHFGDALRELKPARSLASSTELQQQVDQALDVARRARDHASQAQ